MFWLAFHVRFAHGGLHKWPEQQDPNLDPDALVGIVLQRSPEQQDPNLDLHVLACVPPNLRFEQGGLQRWPEQQDPNLDPHVLACVPRAFHVGRAPKMAGTAGSKFGT